MLSYAVLPYCLEFVWNMGSLDWKEISVDEIIQRVTSKVQPGSIVLVHNAALHTPEALPGIIEALLQDGYKFVPISELIIPGECGWTIPWTTPVASVGREMTSRTSM